MFDYSSLVGIPYVRGGRDSKTGLDCFGICLEVFKGKGITDFPDFGAPEKSEEIHALMMEGVSLFEKVEFPEEGNIVALCVNHMRFVTHIGIMISRYEFIHTNEKSRSVVSAINDPFWSKRIKGYYRYVGKTANN